MLHMITLNMYKSESACYIYRCQWGCIPESAPDRSTSYRFDNPLLLGAALVPGRLQVCQISRQHERLRKEAKLFLTKLSQKSREITPQPVLASELERTGIVVEL